MARMLAVRSTLTCKSAVHSELGFLVCGIRHGGFRLLFQVHDFLTQRTEETALGLLDIFGAFGEN